MQEKTREELLEKVKALQHLIQEMPVNVTVTISVPVEDLDELLEIYRDVNDEDLRELQRHDVGWLKAHLTDSEGSWKYRGNYLGVIGKAIRAWSDSKKLVQLELEEKLGPELAAKAVIVPFQVPDEEANNEWMELQNQLGFDIHPT